jgi:peptide/nickel transport system substrate-binding protein
MQRYLRVRWLAVLLATALLLGGCFSRPAAPPDNNPQPDPSKPVEGGTLYLSMFSAPKGVFNPILYEDAYDANIIGLVFNGLVKLNEKLEYVPDLAERMEISADNKTITFHLRKGVKWHDGREFTTEDVAFTFRSMLHPEYTGVRTDSYKDLIGVEGMLEERSKLDQEVQAGKLKDADANKKKLESWQKWLDGDGKKAINVIDKYTVSFATAEPYAPFLENLGFNIIPAHVFAGTEIGKLGEHPATKKPVGTGPFKFVEYRIDQYAELVRNETYFEGKPFIEKVIYKVLNQDVAIGQLQSGEIDHMPVKPDQLDLLKGNKSLIITEWPDFGYQYMGINHDHEYLKDKRVRQALMYGIDRKAIVDNLLKGNGTVMNSHMPPVSWAYDSNSLNAYPYDPEKAKALLAEAGWKDRNAEGYLVRDGKVFEVVLKYPSGNKVREASAPLIQDNLKRIGVKINLQIMEFATLAQTVFDNRDMQLWLMGWGLSTDPDPGPIFLPTNKWGKVTGWTNPRNEELIKAGVRVLKPADRKPIYVEWSKILNDELPYVFLYSQNSIHAINNRVKGLKPDVRGPFWNIYELWIPKDQQK